MKRFLFIVLVAVMVCGSVSAQETQGNPGSSDPAKTLKAPFAEQSPQSGGSDLMSIYKGIHAEGGSGETADTRPIDKAHRSEAQLAEWLKEVVPQTMTYSNADVNTEYKQSAVYFTPPGLEAYRSWLQSSGLLYRMQQEKKRIATISDGAPVLLNQGVGGAIYKWLFDVPVMMTLIPEDIDSISKQRFETIKYVVRIQATRTDVKTLGGDITDDVKIELWTVQAPITAENGKQP